LKGSKFSLKHEVKKLEPFYLVIEVRRRNACRVGMDQGMGLLPESPGSRKTLGLRLLELKKKDQKILLMWLLPWRLCLFEAQRMKLSA
jgi:hypothetical protein